MQFSDFGTKITTDAGILRLMDDLGKAMADGVEVAMFGGGNPAHIPAVTKAYEQSLHTILQDEKTLGAMLGNYDTPQGGTAFIDTVVRFFNRHHGMNLTAANVAITPGSQAGYFMLFNILAGQTAGRQKKILFPLLPEYIGYTDQALEPDMFVSQRPKLAIHGPHEFKYQVDFDALQITDDIAAICVSRPTNPSGNVITDEEVAQLSALATQHDIPLIIDNAYGQPFPGVVVPETTLAWNPSTVLSFSLSKIGLPAARVGIFIGPPQLMQALANANAVVNLASPSLGQYLARPLIEDDRILELSKNAIQPYYFDRAKKAKALLEAHLPDNLPWHMHTYEGSYFFWLWCQDMPITSMELYDPLKKRGVLIVPGEYFFMNEDPATWPHAHECFRMNFSRPDAELENGIPILAQEIQKAYATPKGQFLQPRPKEFVKIKK